MQSDSTDNAPARLEVIFDLERLRRKYGAGRLLQLAAALESEPLRTEIIASLKATAKTSLGSPKKVPRGPTGSKGPRGEDPGRSVEAWSSLIMGKDQDDSESGFNPSPAPLHDHRGSKPSRKAQ